MDSGVWSHGGPRGLLEGLTDAFPPDADDAVELSVESRGTAGAMVYTRRCRDSAAFARLFRSLAAPPDTVAVFGALLARIPAPRHAVKVTTARGLSIFFPVDLTPGAIRTLCEPLGLAEHGEPVAAAFRPFDGRVCGVALELPLSTGAARLRFYGMANGRSAPGKIAASCACLGLSAGATRELATTWGRFCAAENGAVVNVEATSQYGIGLKVEYPGVPPDRAGMLARTRSERRTLATARHLMRLAGGDRFSYVGVRWSGAGRALSFYVDARPLLSCGHPRWQP